MPKSLPDSWAMKPLVPIGCAEFHGDRMPEQWSLNNDFDKGKIYPIYSQEGDFPIGKDGVGKKFHENNWRNLIFF